LQTSFIYEKLYTQKSNQLIVFQQIKNTIITVKEKNKIYLFQTLESLKSPKNRVLNSYLSGLYSYQSLESKTLKNFVKYDHKWIFIIDSLGVYQLPKLKPESILLIQSPKINLERLIQTLHPKIIIVDGSNYKSYTSRWENTCKKKQVSFYNTATKGAFVKTLSP
jgi:competence protein ComEC